MAFSFIKLISPSDSLTKRETTILKICPPAIITSAEVIIAEYDPILGQCFFLLHQHDQTVPTLFHMLCLSDTTVPSLPAPFVIPSSVLIFMANFVL